MANINRFVASGNITRDPELKVTQSGTTMLKFGIAVNEYQAKAEHVNFFECVVFGKYAEAIQPYLIKGQKVAIAGSLHYSSWSDPGTGYKRSRVEVYVRHIDTLGPRKDAPDGAARPAEVVQSPDDLYDTDIPF